jgi:spore germination cell wall hydrolase CwlJ-like protein
MTVHPYPPLPLPVREEPEYLLLVPADTMRPSHHRIGILAAALVFAIALLGTALLYQRLTAGGDTVVIGVRTAIPRDLVDATRGARGARHAEGHEAQQINASLPFSTSPLQAARPFGFSAGTMSDHARALHCLTQAVYYEAGFEPVEGRRAVAQVVLNRVRHPAFPKSVCGVVYDGSSRPGCQFSFTCDGSLRRPPAPAAWAAAAQIARDALAGQVVPAVGLATHYHANYVAPYWAPRLTKLAQIGAHIFYRWPGAWGQTGAFNGRYAGTELIAQPVFADPAAASVGTPIPPVDPTDRRAPEDVGGRLDVTKGWTLSIPLPSETGGRFADAMRSQEDTGSHASASGTGRRP